MCANRLLWQPLAVFQVRSVFEYLFSKKKITKIILFSVPLEFCKCVFRYHLDMKIRVTSMITHKPIVIWIGNYKNGL